MNEFKVADDQWNNFIKDRQARSPAQHYKGFGWKVGDRIPSRTLCTEPPRPGI
jgi:hypothetical protein